MTELTQLADELMHELQTQQQLSHWDAEPHKTAVAGIPRDTLTRIAQMLSPTGKWTGSAARMVYVCALKLDKFPDMTDMAAHMEAELALIQPDMNPDELKAGTVIQDAKTSIGTSGDDVCAICQESMEGKNTVILPCTHRFHNDSADCINGGIRQWFSTSLQCPICRQFPAEGLAGQPNHTVKN